MNAPLPRASPPSIDMPASRPAPDRQAQPLLEADRLVLHFGGVVAADAASLVVHPGERLAIIGPNGAGKTTLLNICTGYLKPAEGHVRFEGRDITRLSPRAITQLGIARAFQIPQLFLEHTVFQNMLIAAAARRRAWSVWRPLDGLDERDAMVDLLRLLGVADDRNRLAGELPEGRRKLVDIAVALALAPRLLLMDEPTSGVASSEKFEIMDLLVGALDARGVTAVFVEHDMEMVTRYADRVAVWNSGHVLAEGPPQEILADPEVRRTVIGS